MSDYVGTINIIVVILFIIVQMMSIAIAGLCLYENYIADQIIDFETYNETASTLSKVSLFALVLLWLFTANNSVIVILFIISAILWLLIAVLSLSISFVKSSIRQVCWEVLRSAVGRMAVLAVVVWLIH